MQTVGNTAQRRFVDVIGVIAVVVGLVLGLMPGIGVPFAWGAGPLGPGQFEIDGDIAGANDWANIGAHADGGELTPDGLHNDDTSWFKASTVESDYPDWTFVEGGNAQKSDLHRLFVASQVAGADSFLWLGASRVADNGSTQVTVEFNQEDGDSIDLGSGYRITGDFFITWNFPGRPSASQDPDKVTVKVGFWPDGRTAGSYPTEVTLGTSDYRYAIGGVSDPDAYDFIELELDLSALFGDGGLGTCGQFGAVSFRTESSGGGGGGGDESTMKDVTQPFPIDLDTCADVELRKVDDDGEGLSGAVFAAFPGHDNTDGDPAATCTTDDDGVCDFGQIEPGAYTLDETVVPAGYRKADGLPYNFTVLANTPLDLGTFTDPRIPYTIDVAPDGRNAVGNDHLFTVTLTSDDGTPMAGETVDLEWTGVGDGITDVDGTPLPGDSSAQCTTDADGQCEVTVSSDEPGSGQLVASWDTPYQNTVAADGSATTDDGEDGTVPYAAISDDGDKVWIGYRAEIAADGLNLVGQPHTFTATVYEVDGEDPDTLAAGVEVTFSWDEGTATGSGLDSLTCTTAADGTCTVEASDGGTPGTGTISIVELDGVVGDDEALTVTFDAGEIAATKTWREYRASISSDSVNPSGEAHTFTVTVEYRDDEADDWSLAPNGTTVAWTSSGDGSDDLDESTCDDGTTDGQCTIVVVSTSPGSRTVTVTGVGGALLGDAGTAEETYDVDDVEATKTWLDFEVDVTPDGHNLVGEDHTFTIHVEQYDGVSYTDVLDGTVVTFTLSDGGTSLVSETCSTGTVDGDCTVTVSSATPGTVTLTATGITGYGGFDVASDVTFGDTEANDLEAEKTWYRYRASIEADGVNLVGDEHTFTVTAQVDDGTGWAPVADGTVVTVTSSGIAATVDQSDCADGTTGGTCEVVVNSASPGTVTITVATVQNVDAVDSDVAAVDVSGGADLDEGQSTSADKTWIAYRAHIRASATNLVGDPHTFELEAQQNDGSGWTTVPDGTVIGFSTTDDATVTDETCSTGTVDGVCTVTVSSDDVGRVTVTVETVQALDVDGQPTADVEDSAATKTWIAIDVDVEADATNIVGEPHTFTITVDVVTPDGTVPVADGSIVTVSTGGTVGSVQTDTCASGTSGGTCEVTVISGSPGQLTVTVDGVAFSHDDTDFVVDLTDESVVGEATIDRDATKTWRDYRTSIEVDGLNLVRDEHVFTVTVEQTDDGETWVPVPDGTLALVELGGTGGITGDDCGTVGTVGGTCEVTVDSDDAGTAKVTVTAIVVAHPDGPQTQEAEQSEIPAPPSVDTKVDTEDSSATKTWVAFRPSISRDSLNLTGDPHDFTLTVEYSTGDGWDPVPDGSTVSFSSDGVGSVSGDSCDATVGGDCTVTVVSDDSGQRSVTVTGVAATISHGGLLESFDVVFEDGASGTLDTLEEATATKTWASYALDIDPDTAQNLLPVDPDHLYVVTLTSDDAQNAPVAGQTIALSISGDVGTITSAEGGTVDEGGLTATCVTDVDGTCDVIISSTVPGAAQLDAAYTAEVGDSEPFEVEAVPSTKTWTTFRVTVTPEQATNLVGNAHVFTVTVERADEDGWWQPVVGAVPAIDVTGTDVTVDASDCAAGTDEAGTCEVVVDSETVQAVTLTAEYEASIDQSTAAFSDQGDKEWIDFAIDVDPAEDTNLVGTDHVLTVTVTTTFPVEDGTQTAPVVGATPTLELTGLGSIVDTTCDEEDGGTDAQGQCTVTITSPVTGLSTLTATYLGTAADDEEVRSYSDSGDKTWIDHRVTLDEDAVNLVGDEHVFTATLEVDDGSGFVPLAGGTLAVDVAGVGELVGTTCGVTDDAGQCTVTIVSDVAGQTTVTVTHAVEEGTLGVVGEAVTRSDEAVKTWVEPAIEVDKTNDADLDSIYTDLETSQAPGSDVAFRAIVTNPGPVPGQVRLYDTLDDGTELYLFGLGAGADGGPVATCDRDGEAFLALDELGVGESIVCLFDLTAYSPEILIDRVNVVRAELVRYEPVVGDPTVPDDQVDPTGDVRVLATAEDDSTVNSTEVLGVVLRKPDPEPEVLPQTGAEATDLFALSLALLLLGSVLLFVNRQWRFEAPRRS